MATEYWTVGRGPAVRNGWTCRECRKPLYRGDDMITRDGRKVRLCYHAACFSGDADPRTQASSSKSEGRLPEDNFRETAPRNKGVGKWTISNYGYSPAPHAAAEILTAGAHRLSRGDSTKSLGEVSRSASFSSLKAGPTTSFTSLKDFGRASSFAGLKTTAADSRMKMSVGDANKAGRLFRAGSGGAASGSAQKPGGGHTLKLKPRAS